MGARQSKRSVDISSTPKKEAAEGAPAEKLEKIEEGDVKVQNGHAEPVTQEGEEGKTEAVTTEAAAPEKTEPADPVLNGDAAEQSSESAATSPTAEEKKADSPAEGDAAKETPKSEEKAEKKKKEKSKKKWSFRSISFSKKDKTKPSMSRDESKSNDLAKEAPVPEEGAPAKSEEETTSPSSPEVATPAIEEPAKETPAPVESKEESAPAFGLDVKSVVSSITIAAESGVQQVVEETTKLVTEAKEAVNTIVETASKTVVEEIKSTIITESASIVKTSTKTIEIVEEALAPPLPASPPPTEAPPPTPVAPQPIQQHEHEEMNGGGEGMAELPEENGLCENDKIDDEPEHELPKMNGHNESPVQQVEEITECLLKTSIEDKVVVDNHLEIAVGNENKE